MASSELRPSTARSGLWLPAARCARAPFAARHRRGLPPRPAPAAAAAGAGRGGNPRRWGAANGARAQRAAGSQSPLRAVLGRNSLLAIDEDYHLGQRRLLLPPFHGERMKGYEAIIEEE